MNSIVKNLNQFNRKERFFLVGTALGNPQFRLCTSFREKVGNAFNLQIPDSAFAAMDYHLDWIYASLFLAFDNSGARIFSNEKGLITATQEDIDFIIAYPMDKTCHIILLEAKGVTGFTNSQLQSKIDRLRDIFGGSLENYRGVMPHFAIISPKKPSEIDTNGWPKWTTRDREPIWIKMAIHEENLKAVTRCDANGKPSAQGKWWRTV